MAPIIQIRLPTASSENRGQTLVFCLLLRASVLRQYCVKPLFGGLCLFLAAAYLVGFATPAAAARQVVDEFVGG